MVMMPLGLSAGGGWPQLGLWGGRGEAGKRQRGGVLLQVRIVLTGNSIDRKFHWTGNSIEQEIPVTGNTTNQEISLTGISIDHEISLIGIIIEQEIPLRSLNLVWPYFDILTANLRYGWFYFNCYCYLLNWTILFGCGENPRCHWFTDDLLSSCKITKSWY